MRAAIVLLALATTARAERPTLAGEATYGTGEILVHYATTGADAASMPLVVEVATTAEQALAHYRALGFRRPLPDGTLGGDGRIDIYLRELDAADGNAGIDSCAANTCIGFAVAENDYAGYAYPSITEGIRSVVPHELFHLVQYAYAMDQPAAWTEGSAVWAVEQLYGDGNSDFERFVPAFLMRTFRPFERSGAGFGDAFPYGAALWPYFLEHRFGVGAVVDAWTASADAPFLDAVDRAIEPTVDDAWVEFTRWNALTGPHATSGAYPDAGGWPAALRESGPIYVEGLSARYVPLVLAERSRIEVRSGSRTAAWVIADGAAFEDGIDLADAAPVEAGSYTLVVTGLSRGTIATAVDVAIVEDSGGCSSTPAPSLAIALLFLRRRRQRGA